MCFLCVCLLSKGLEETHLLFSWKSWKSFGQNDQNHFHFHKSDCFDLCCQGWKRKKLKLEARLYGLWLLELLVSDHCLWHHQQQRSRGSSSLFVKVDHCYLLPCNSYLLLTTLLLVKCFDSLERKTLSEQNYQKLIFCQATCLLYGGLMPVRWEGFIMRFSKQIKWILQRIKQFRLLHDKCFNLLF